MTGYVVTRGRAEVLCCDEQPGRRARERERRSLSSAQPLEKLDDSGMDDLRAVALHPVTGILDHDQRGVREALGGAAHRRERDAGVAIPCTTNVGMRSSLSRSL